VASDGTDWRRRAQVHVHAERTLAEALDQLGRQRLLGAGVLEDEVGVFPGAQRSEFVLGLAGIGLVDLILRQPAVRDHGLDELRFLAGARQRGGGIGVELALQDQAAEQGLFLFAGTEGHADDAAVVEDEIPAALVGSEAQDARGLDAVDGLEDLDQGECTQVAGETHGRTC